MKTKKEKKEEMKQTMHRLQQEDYKKKIHEMGKTIIENLHPSGGFDKKTGLVYEPLGNFKYIFKFKGYKGIGEAMRIARIECPSCGTIIRKYSAEYEGRLRCSCGRQLNYKIKNYELYEKGIEGTRFIFKGTPLEKKIFNIPSDGSIKFWLNNYFVDKQGKEIDAKFIFEILKSFFQTFFDLPIQRSHDILAIAVLQSWLIPILDVLFYISISGETGSGKTALLEALMLVCRHGLSAGNIKSAGIARCSEKYNVSLGIDEIDSKKFKNDDIDGICRQGYRRGLYYIRMMPKTHIPEFFNVFGFKAFSYRSSLVDDLQNRSLDIPINKTKNKKIPVINLFKQYFSPFEILFFWYLDNIENLYIKSPTFQRDLDKFDENVNTRNPLVNMGVNKVNTINKVNDKTDEKALKDVNNVNAVNNINTINVNEGYKPYKLDRSSIGQKTPFLDNYINLINEYNIFGRNIEIAYLIYSLTQILGLDISEILLETIEQKQEIEEASQDEGWVGLLKELFVEEYEKATLKEGVKIVSYKKLVSKYIRRMKEVYENIPSQYQIKKMLRQIGFIDGINRKVIRIEEKAKLCFIYDSKIKEKLGLRELQQKIKEEKIEGKIKEEK